MEEKAPSGAAGRIMGKLGPLDELEEESLKWRGLRPEDYVTPSLDGVRTCGVCLEEFKDRKIGGVMVPALDQFAEHTTEHNPSPYQWATAHQMSRKG